MNSILKILTELLLREVQKEYGDEEELTPVLEVLGLQFTAGQQNTSSGQTAIHYDKPREL